MWDLWNETSYSWPAIYREVQEIASGICWERHSLEPQSLEPLCRESLPWGGVRASTPSWKLGANLKSKFPSLPAEGSVVQRPEKGLGPGAAGSGPDCSGVAVICTISLAQFFLMAVSSSKFCDPVRRELEWIIQELQIGLHTEETRSRGAGVGNEEKRE